MPSHLSSILGHAWGRQWGFLCSVLVALLLAAILVRSTGLRWWPWGDAIITFATVGVAVIKLWVLGTEKGTHYLLSETHPSGADVPPASP